MDSLKPGKPNLVIVPTYNEAENINRLLFEVIRDVPNVEVLVVDDNSPDGTRDIVTRFMQHEPRVHILNRAKKDGLAAAYIAGFQWGLDRNYDIIIEMDADFSHRPSDVNRLLESLKTNDVAVGCRYTEGGGISGWGFLRQFISRGGNYYARFILGLPVQDLTGGFNAWKRAVLEKIDIHTIRSQGYSFQVELKFRALKNKFTLQEVPIHFQNREHGYSKMSGRIVWEAAFRVLQMRRNQAPKA